MNKYVPFSIASASKSFIGDLIGIALKKNYLTSLDQKMLDFFPEYITPDLDPRKYYITIRHLLKFRSGYPHDESTYPGSNDIVLTIWWWSDDWMKFAVECPLAADPGETYAYYTGAMTKVWLGEVNAGTTEFWCRNVPGDNNRTYGIASVTSGNRESVPAAITVR